MKKQEKERYICPRIRSNYIGGAMQRSKPQLTQLCCTKSILKLSRVYDKLSLNLLITLITGEDNNTAHEHKQAHPNTLI